MLLLPCCLCCHLLWLLPTCCAGPLFAGGVEFKDVANFTQYFIFTPEMHRCCLAVFAVTQCNRCHLLRRSSVRRCCGVQRRGKLHAVLQLHTRNAPMLLLPCCLCCHPLQPLPSAAQVLPLAMPWSSQTWQTSAAASSIQAPVMLSPCCPCCHLLCRSFLC